MKSSLHQIVGNFLNDGRLRIQGADWGRPGDALAHLRHKKCSFKELRDQFVDGAGLE